MISSVRRNIQAATLLLPLLLGLLCTTQLRAMAEDTVADPIAIYKEAGADEDQQRKILALANNYERSADRRAHELIAALKQLRALSLNPDLNEKLIFKTQATINTLQNDMALEKVRLLVDIRKLLNKEQRFRLVALMQNKSRPDNALDHDTPR